MLIRIVINWLIIAAAVYLAAQIVPGVEIEGGFGTLLWVALLFGLVNAILGPILHLLALPLTVLTLGLFALVVNAALLAITAAITSNLQVDGFWATVFGALVIAIVAAVLGYLTRNIGEPESA